MSNVGTLRRAALLMRRKAEAARASLSDNVPEWHSHQALMRDGKTPGDAEHIASWHPAVALAVADVLDDHAETAELFVSKELPASAWSMNWQTAHNRALAVARAYLGEA